MKISIRKGEIYRFEEWIYDVERLWRLVARSPEEYGPHIQKITPDFLHHISKYKDADSDWIAQMPPERVFDPVLAIEDDNGQLRVVDGYHRIRRIQSDGGRQFTFFLVPKEKVGRFRSRAANPL